MFQICDILALVIPYQPYLSPMKSLSLSPSPSFPSLISLTISFP